MRLWTLHPRYLDSRGLVALWREALLARAVLRGDTVGYRRHPQLDRFRAHPAPRYRQWRVLERPEMRIHCSGSFPGRLNRGSAN